MESRNQTHPSELNVDDLMEFAFNKFTTGHEIQRKINAQLNDLEYKENMKIYFNGKEFSQEEKPGFKLIRNKIRNLEDEFCDFTSYPDPNFTIDANPIRGTRLIASQGPQDAEELGKFFKDTVDNPNISIHKVVALGRILAIQPIEKDFHEYCLRERTNELVGNYIYSSTKSEGEFNELNVRKQQKFNPTSIIRSHLSIQSRLTEEKDAGKKPRELDIILIPLKDNYPFDLTIDNDDKLKEILWEIYNDAYVKNENILIHCASGVGRTGHLILTLELLRHYKSIFEAKNIEVATHKIMEIVDRMRENRFCLIQVQYQFTRAINNAYVLYKYGLEKGYVKDNAETPVASVSQTPQTLFAANNPLVVEQPSSLVVEPVVLSETTEPPQTMKKW